MDGHVQSLLLPHQDHPFLGAGDGGVDKIPAQQFVKARQQGQDDHRILAALALMYGQRIRQLDIGHLALAVFDGTAVPEVKDGDTLTFFICADAAQRADIAVADLASVPGLYDTVAFPEEGVADLPFLHAETRRVDLVAQREVQAFGAGRSAGRKGGQYLYLIDGYTGDLLLVQPLDRGASGSFVRTGQELEVRPFQYNFNADKAFDVYVSSCEPYTTLPKNSNTKLLITTAAQQLTAARAATASLRQEMIRMAQQLPEYETVRAIYGVGDITAAQLIAEIGDVRRFAHRSALVAFAGVDPAVNQSGKHTVQSNPVTKRGSPHLRKILYQVVCAYLKESPSNESVYQFLDKKRAEGKPYFVYMTAAQNKFLRIYYARVKECLTAGVREAPEQK